jgi:hypothetical protein
MNIITYSIFDIIFLLFAVVLSIALGEQSQPNPVAFALVFIGSRVVVYRLWFAQVEKRETPWLKLAIQSVFFLVTIPIIIAISSYAAPALSNNIFWFALTPAASFIPFIVIHRFYKIV